MLRDGEQITFVPELAALIEDFVHEYERQKGPLRDDLERGLAISYALGIMCCDLRAVWDGLAQADVFRGLHPRAVFEECLGRDGEATPELGQEVAAILRKKGWPSATNGFSSEA